MANTFRVKRRAAGGAAGAPASLANAELAFNEQDKVLYYGEGTGGAGGTATQAIPIAGPGAFVDKTTAQTIDGIKTFTSGPLVPTQTAGTNNTQAASTAFVAAAVTAGSVTDDSVTNLKLANMAVNTLKGRVTAGTGDPEDLSTAQVRILLAINNVDNTGDTSKPVSSAQQTALDLKANLAGPTFTGVPLAPTAAPGTNTTQIATTAFTTAAVAALVAASPAALDTLNELAAALGNDANFATTTSTNLGLKMVKSANLSDVANVATARTNLGLGTMATQNANAVAITGGTLDNVTIDGGTF